MAKKAIAKIVKETAKKKAAPKKAAPKKAAPKKTTAKKATPKKAAPKKKAAAKKPSAAPHACPSLSEQLFVLKEDLRAKAKAGDQQAAKALSSVYAVLAHIS